MYVDDFDPRFPFVVPPETVHKRHFHRLEKIVPTIEQNWNDILECIANQAATKTVLKVAGKTRIGVCSPTINDSCIVKLIPIN